MSRKKILVIIIVTVNLLFAWSVFNMFYYKKTSFDTSEKVKLNISNVDKIFNGDGSWRWNGKEYDFYKEYSFSLTKNQIKEFSNIINSANAKYIENIRPKKWFDINIAGRSGDIKTITLKQSNENEIYFEIDHKTFDGRELEKYIEKIIKQK
jgi:hypothetical protein